MKLGSVFGTLVLMLAASCADDEAGISLDAAVVSDVLPDDSPVLLGDARTPLPDWSLEVPCNGAPFLCSMTYDTVTFAGTHASMAAGSPEWARPTQDRPIRRQLDEGIRALFLEVHPFQGGMSLCLGDCANGNLPFDYELQKVREFLEVNPREIVTILFSSYVSVIDLADGLRAVGLEAYAHSQDLSQPWPALDEMIKSGRRLVVFSDVAPGDAALAPSDADGSARAPTWILPLLRVTWATSATFRSPSEMNCAPSLGASSNPLYIVHHFLVEGDIVDGALTDGGASEKLAKEVNMSPFLPNRLASCLAQHGKRPSFVDVDFYDIGSVTDAARAISESP